MPNALWLPNLTIVGTKETDDTVDFLCTCSTEPPCCAKCGVIGHLYKHGTGRNRYQDAPAYGKQVFIRVDVQRYRCRSCKATFVQPMPDMDGRRQMTRRCVEFIAKRGVAHTYSAIARDIGLTEKTVRDICTESFRASMATREIKAPMLLGIDELTLDGKNRRRTIFVDLGTRKPLDIIDSMSRRAVDRWLWALPKRDGIQVVAIDMWRPYRDAVRAILPQAKIVVDKFHVVVPVGMALDKVRNRARSVSSTPRKNPRAGKVLLQTSRHSLSPMRQMLLDGVLANNPLIADAWRAKEAFYDIWRTDSRAEAERLFDQWRAAIPASIEREFGPVAQMIENWREEIFAYFDYPITNAYTEAANGIIKVANRAGRGYAFGNIRAKALLAQSPNTQPCDICKDEFPASSLRPVSIPLGGEEFIRDACGNCHYVFHVHWTPGWGKYLSENYTTKSD